MFRQILFAIGVSIGVAQACDCGVRPVKEKLRYADIVFRGTLTELRESKAPIPSYILTYNLAKDTGKVAVFRVSRVWKGKVGQVFEMPALAETAACVGFSPDSIKIGVDLLIYANGSAKEGYTTSICGQHMPADEATEDLRKLGSGRPPK
jgi:hypothetical protein